MAEKNSELFTLREARAEDMPHLNVYAYNEGMDNLPNEDGIIVAVNDDEIPVGFIRVVFGENNAWHINPVVTCTTWRGHGVGRALVEQALKDKGELRLVARGASVPFYSHLGFEPCAWEEVDLSATEDCTNCPMREECKPQPMKS